MKQLNELNDINLLNEIKNKAITFNELDGLKTRTTKMQQDLKKIRDERDSRLL